MTRTVEAVYDGAVLRPETALGLEPNTRVRLTVEDPAGSRDGPGFIPPYRALSGTARAGGLVREPRPLSLWRRRSTPGMRSSWTRPYALALSAPTDQFHGRALRLAEELETARARLVTTRAVLLEIGNALSRQRHRAAAIRLLQALEADPSVEVLSLSEELYARALQLYCSRLDKEWGLIDCASFVVMSERGLTKALTADEHFQQAGFRALLREGDG